MDFTEDFRKKYLTKDYGHYEKYEMNKVTTVYDEGELENTQDKFYEHYMRMVSRLPTVSAKDDQQKKVEDIKGMLTATNKAHSEFGEQYMSWKTSEEQTKSKEDELNQEYQFMNNPTTYEAGYVGRLSPMCKEMIYREYLKGTSQKDLGLKYGIL
jgi:nucleoside diphosphate kinase